MPLLSKALALQALCPKVTFQFRQRARGQTGSVLANAGCRAVLARGTAGHLKQYAAAALTSSARIPAGRPALQATFGSALILGLFVSRSLNALTRNILSVAEARAGATVEAGTGLNVFPAKASASLRAALILRILIGAATIAGAVVVPGMSLFARMEPANAAPPISHTIGMVAAKNARKTSQNRVAANAIVEMSAPIQTIRIGIASRMGVILAALQIFQRTAPELITAGKIRTSVIKLSSAAAKDGPFAGILIFQHGIASPMAIQSAALLTSLSGLTGLAGSALLTSLNSVALSVTAMLIVKVAKSPFATKTT